MLELIAVYLDGHRYNLVEEEEEEADVELTVKLAVDNVTECLLLGTCFHT